MQNGVFQHGTECLMLHEFIQWLFWAEREALMQSIIYEEDSSGVVCGSAYKSSKSAQCIQTQQLLKQHCRGHSVLLRQQMGRGAALSSASCLGTVQHCLRTKPLCSLFIRRSQGYSRLPNSSSNVHTRSCWLVHFLMRDWLLDVLGHPHKDGVHTKETFTWNQKIANAVSSLTVVSWKPNHTADKPGQLLGCKLWAWISRDPKSAVGKKASHSCLAMS